MFIPAFILKSDKLTDISYSITFIVLAVFGFYRSTQNNLDKLILILVLLWAIRLGVFLFIRINKIGKDVRFDGMREHFLPFLRFWLLQGATVFVVMLAALLGYQQKYSNISILTFVGIIVFLSGFIIESVADAQKFRFSSEIKNKGHWIDVGIWRSSRHPNYLGEIMVWTGMYLVVATSLKTSELFIALLSPVFIISLLLFVSGVPLLEKSAQKKWGDQKEFNKYKNEVPVLIPNFGSVKRITKNK
jgi:steroid 5-alpha reductase family enzyme